MRRAPPSDIRPQTRSSALFKKCGPGTSTMHGQTATRRKDEVRSKRTARPPITPARIAAEKGCRNGFSLSRPSPRRRSAPAPALTKMSPAADMCWRPKITAKATAPAAAANTKSQVGAGGDRSMPTIAVVAASCANRPDTISSTARIPRATRSISTPKGSAAIAVPIVPPSSSATSCSSPQRGRSVARNPRAWPSRWAAPTVCSVACPLTKSDLATARTRMARSSQLIARWAFNAQRSARCRPPHRAAPSFWGRRCGRIQLR